MTDSDKPIIRASPIDCRHASMGCWYETSDAKQTRLFCIGQDPSSLSLGPVFITRDMTQHIISQGDGQQLTPLPMCEGWDWSPTYMTKADRKKVRISSMALVNVIAQLPTSYHAGVLTVLVDRLMANESFARPFGISKFVRALEVAAQEDTEEPERHFLDKREAESLVDRLPTAWFEEVLRRLLRRGLKVKGLTPDTVRYAVSDAEADFVSQEAIV